MLFLGGSCNPTTWRQDIAMPFLERHNAEYFNPQVEDWSPECVEIERKAKKNAEAYLFMIDGQTRGIASMLEVVALSHVHRDKSMHVVVHDIPDGIEIAGATITGRELKDLNNSRQYLLDAIKDLTNVYIFETLEDALRRYVKHEVNVI